MRAFEVHVWVSVRETKLARLTLDVARPRPGDERRWRGRWGWGETPVGASGNRSRLLHNSSSNNSNSQDFVQKEARGATAYVVPAMVKTETGRKGEEGKKSIEAPHMLHTVNNLPPPPSPFPSLSNRPTVR